MRSADRARRDGIRAFKGADWDAFNRETIGQLAHEPVIVADDVASWRSHVEPADDNDPRFMLENTPPMPPPWKVAWIEYPSRSGDERRGVLVLDQTATFEFFDGGYRLAPGYHQGGWTDLLEDAIGDAAEKGVPSGEIGWLVTMALYVDAQRHVYGPFGMLVFVLDKAGRIAGNRWLYTGSPASEAALKAMADIGPEMWLLGATDAAVWTLALLNMRNITTEQIIPPTVRRHRKRGNLPPVRYHVLRLKLPGGRQTGLDGSQDGPDGERLHQGVHMVRGHLSHYGDCCPGAHPPQGLLFGKLAGVFWVPAHLAGRDEDRVIVTDYEANADVPLS